MKNNSVSYWIYTLIFDAWLEWNLSFNDYYFKKETPAFTTESILSSYVYKKKQKKTKNKTL